MAQMRRIFAIAATTVKVASLTSLLPCRRLGRPPRGSRRDSRGAARGGRRRPRWARPTRRSRPARGIPLEAGVARHGVLHPLEDGLRRPLRVEDAPPLAEVEEDLEVGPDDRRRDDGELEPLDEAEDVHERPFLAGEARHGEEDVGGVGEEVRPPPVDDERLRPAERQDELRVGDAGGELRVGDVEDVRRVRPVEEAGEGRALAGAGDARGLGAAGVRRGFPADEPAAGDGGVLDPPLGPEVGVELDVGGTRRFP